MVSSGVETLYDYDVNDRLLMAGTVSFAYDAAGNTTQMVDGATTFTYDYNYENRLASVSDGAATTYFTDDADGNLVGVDNGAEQLAYLVDELNHTGYSQVLAERDAGGNLRSLHLRP